MRFSIRDLLWLTVVVALVLGWWLEHLRSASLERECNEARGAKEDAIWLAGLSQANFIDYEIAQRTEEILKKYGTLPSHSATEFSTDSR